MASNRFPLVLLPEAFAVCKLDPEGDLPLEVLDDGPLACLLRTDDELSLVCREEDAPPSAMKVEPGWRAFRLEGPVPFETVGVVSGMTRPLAEAGIGVFVLSTFDTDYLLVKARNADRAAKLLAKAGYPVS